VRRLFDSSILIAHLRGEAAATRLLLDTAGGDRLASVLSRTEIEGGMRSPERADVARLFAVMHLVPVSDAVAARAGEHLRRYRRSHQGIDLVDFVIAASAEVHEAQLVTLNTKHFPMFKGLRRPW
jgi:predicted nucleic acid-binding protein